MQRFIALALLLVATPATADLADDIEDLFETDPRAIEVDIEACVLRLRFAYSADAFSNVLTERYALRDLDFAAAEVEPYEDGTSASWQVPLLKTRVAAYEDARAQFSEAKSAASSDIRQSRDPSEWSEGERLVNETFRDGALAGEYGAIPIGSLSVFREERDGRIDMGVAVNTGLAITTRGGDPVATMSALGAYAAESCPPV